ncbi:MAG: acetyl-CoA carboxylase, carboxyltransferase subunit beta [Treponema sp.]|jgi:acetyl-CoA carboxylase carboxyl transferase subunit beta|nr:acetyl-CoA carboxylase, carboxyltransferase subunit beta [Treponema sp.]
MKDFTCPQCQTPAGEETFAAQLWVCQKCAYHSRIGWQDRLNITIDKGSFSEFDPGMKSGNPIGFPGYEEKVKDAQSACQTNEAVVTGRCSIGGYPAVLCVMDSRFMMASMGSVVGEKITRAIEYATEHKLPVIIFNASGGARMQEGIISLMQMAKTSGALARHNKAGELFISVICDPTTGGVTASFAMLGDIIIGEPGVTIGFAGKRVIQNTIGAVLPENFQTAEFTLEHGFADMIVSRTDMASALGRLIRLHGYKKGDFNAA